MTVTLELSPDAESAAQAEARARGVRVESYLQKLLEQAIPHPLEAEGDNQQQQRLEILSQLRGKYTGLPGGSEEFAAQKAEEKAREERHWRGEA